jgi:hypothetical protein
LTENVRSIFQTNIHLLGEIDKSVYYFREQQYGKALSFVVNSIDQINMALESIIKNREYFNLVDTKSMLKMLTGILAAQKNKDYILLADLLELQLVNFLIGVQELIISKEEIIFDEDSYKESIALLLEREAGFPEEVKEPIDTALLLANGYRVEFTSCGLMTLAAENEGTEFYFHTNSKVLSEAFLLARRWYREEIKRYIIFGFGMGYYIKELHRLAPEAELVIYETDCNVVQLACAFTDVRELLQSNRIKLIFDPELNLFLDRIAELSTEETFHINYPSYMNIRSKEGKKLLETKLSWSEVINI